MERGGRVGDDLEGGNAVRYVGQADDVYVVGTSEEADQGREQGQDGGGGGSDLVQSLQMQIAVLQDQLARITKNTNV